MAVANVSKNDKFKVKIGSVGSGKYGYGANEKVANTLQIYRLGETQNGRYRTRK